MKSCRDCVHYKPCQEWAIDFCRGDTMFPYEAETGEEICEHYTPTADVVPKSEVERLQGALKAEERHNELTMEMAQKALQNAKVDVAREIFEEIERTFNTVLVGDISDILKVLAELKKKYTEKGR